MSKRNGIISLILLLLNAFSLTPTAIAANTTDSHSHIQTILGYTVLVDSKPSNGSHHTKASMATSINHSSSSASIENTEVPNNKKIALIFDDGPDATYTDQILNILKQYNVLATFFFVGQNVVDNPDVARRVAEAGCEIGNHSYTHSDLSLMDPETAYNNEILITNDVFSQVMNVQTKLFRAPSGEFTGSEASYIEQQGYTIVNSDVSTLDWNSAHDADFIYNQAVNYTDNNDIVVMHSAGPRAPTVEALPRIIVALQAKGYTLVTVSEILGIDQ